MRWLEATINFALQEEQNASSSANYDVELLHSAKAHLELLRTGWILVPASTFMASVAE